VASTSTDVKRASAYTPSSSSSSSSASTASTASDKKHNKNEVELRRHTTNASTITSAASDAIALDEVVLDDAADLSRLDKAQRKQLEKERKAQEKRERQQQKEAERERKQLEKSARKAAKHANPADFTIEKVSSAPAAAAEASSSASSPASSRPSTPRGGPAAHSEPRPTPNASQREATVGGGEGSPAVASGGGSERRWHAKLREGGASRPTSMLDGHGGGESDSESGTSGSYLGSRPPSALSSSCGGGGGAASLASSSSSVLPPVAPVLSDDPRENVVNEVLNTERDYVRDLHVLVDVYLLPLRENGLLSPQQMHVVFSSVESMLPVNEELLRCLESGDGVGKAFLAVGQFLKIYSDYCNNQNAAYALLAEMSHKSDDFAGFLQYCKTRPESRGQDLASFLIKPVQRICKYPLLLRELIKNTPESHPDHQELLRARDLIEKSVNTINDRKRDLEASEDLFVLQNQIEGVLDRGGLLSPARKLIEEADIRQIVDGKVSEAHYFFFNDLFVLTTPMSKNERYHLLAYFPLSEALLNVVPSANASPNSMELVQIARDKVMLYVDDLEEKKKLVKKLQEQIRAAGSPAGDVQVVGSNLPRSLNGHPQSATNRGRFMRQSTVQKAMPPVPQHLRDQPRSPSNSPISPRQSSGPISPRHASSVSTGTRAGPARPVSATPAYSSSWSGSPTRFVTTSQSTANESQLRGRQHRGGYARGGASRGRGASLRTSVNKPLPVAPSRGARGRGAPGSRGTPGKPLPPPPKK